MNLHQILKTVPKEWHSVATHYVKGLQRAGVPADKLDSLVQWGVAYQGPGDEEALLSSFRAQASRLGLESHVTSLAADWGLEAREEINSGKWQPEPAPPSDNASLLADIRAYRQQWPDEYGQDKAMQEAELALIAADLGEKPPKVSGQLPTTPGAQRMMEIRQIMRDEPDRYNADKALQAEQLGLIEADLASRSAQQPTSQPAPAASGDTGEPT
ncbi:hypothetical protein RX330_20360 [Bradyrhizobium sp. NDS-1]|uniref:hypothetical protein n=1 Tax=Bradyrhizobium sp. NDS-1 TaxID=3080014 RepID=UPI00293EDBCE|nr:hypothetical protein [Bradyrhizobium sp. NDS-1]WOH70653.1 hypothetical protein RX330_20360 [Bradyrhizobium sp. NDS-1]